MKITPNWIFDFDTILPDKKMVTHWDTLTVAEFMYIIGRHVISAPVDIDWQDRYGWTAIPISQFNKFQADVKTAVSDWATGKG